MTAEAIRSVRNAFSVLMLAALCACRRDESPSETLMALAPHSGRPIEARLTGFDWPAARLQRAAHANLLDPARLELAGAASAVIQSQLSDSSARARHESGAAYLLIDRDRDAIDALESAVRQSPNNAAYWSDLAAARYTLAVTENRPHELPQALADADHALRLDSKLHDTLFNRALIIEALGISEAARRAWQRYAAADPSSHWSAEALHHLGDLRVVTTRDEFQHRLAAATRALPDAAALIALARNFPQEARTWSEGPLLAKWADAFHKGDSGTATETLTVVRTLGAALAEFNHVQSVAEIVATIDRANPADTKTLADAHAIYRDARVLYKDRRIADAQKKLQEARALFAHTGSPMALIADYYLANCLYDSNRPTEALRALDIVAAHFDARRYPASLAEIGWEQTLCYSAIGDWDAAIRTATRSRKSFAALGETINRGQVDVLVADDLDHMSQPAGAWKARVAAFSALSQAGASDSIRHALTSAINAATAHGNYDAARALTAIILEELQNARLPNDIAAAEAGRAEILAKLGDFEAARRTIAESRHNAAEISDRNLQRRTSVTIDLAEAAVVRKSDPSRALQLLDGAMTFLESGHDNAWLPRVYLERGRTYVQLHQDKSALADFQAGLNLLQTQRSSIQKHDARGTFYDIAPDLFSENVSLLLRQRDVSRASSVSDSSRSFNVQAGATYDGAVAPASLEIGRAVPPTTAFIEYTLLQDSVAIFRVSAQGVFVTLTPVNTANLRRLIEHCADGLQRRADVAAVQRDSASLYRLLIAPIAPAIANAHELIIVPDRQLNAVPFAALYDTARQRYLIDDFALSIAPSAAFAMKPRASRKLTPALIVGDPHGAGSAALPEAVHEAEAIATMYDSATLLTGNRATRARFIEFAETSSMIHYAGHAQSDSDDLSSALGLLPDQANTTGDLNAGDIGRLHLRNEPLVVLAACGTIRGESEHVEGMPSVARAFLTAGARGVIGTLWEIDDEHSSTLFRRLHEELRSGATESAALRTAQIALAHGSDARLNHPSTWASVELLGR
jgi:CHAT domain-containing protein